MAGPSRGDEFDVSGSRRDGDAVDVSIVQAAFDAPGDYNDAERTLLQSCTMYAAPGGLTTISGPVGSGKTTLVRAILGDVRPRAGSVQVSGRIAYASQKPFLINGSIRENILFGLPLDAPWYKQVVEATCLQPRFRPPP